MEVIVTTTPTLLVAAKPTNQRAWVTIDLWKQEPSAVFIGINDPSVTTNTGRRLLPGFGMTIENDAFSKPASHATYAVVSAGTAILRITEGT